MENCSTELVQLTKIERSPNGEKILEVDEDAVSSVARGGGGGGGL